jgi:hypothetical protein
VDRLAECASFVANLPFRKRATGSTVRAATASCSIDLATKSRPAGTVLYPRRPSMNEDTFNAEVRKFLKKVGITSQRALESGVREALGAGRLSGSETLKASMRLVVPELGIDLHIEDTIALE